MNSKSGELLSFDDWSRKYDQVEHDECEDDDVSEVKEEILEIAAEPIMRETNEALQKIRKLCRVCSSMGLISISSNISQSYLKVKVSGNKKNWDVPIAQIIAEVSGEKVSQDDLLPQFICEHCLGYLQHAYQMRLKIILNTANLKLALEIAKEESVYLENTQIDQSRITKREVEEWNEDTNEEGHFYEQFQGANIKINSNPLFAKHVARAIEYKCPSCNKRIMSIKSLNDHMDCCEIRVLDAFFSQFKSIYSMKLQAKLTTTEYILYAIKLLFETHKQLGQIVKAKNIDVSSITAEIPAEEIDFTPHLPTQIRQQRAYHSPDNGYISGGNVNVTPR